MMDHTSSDINKTTGIEVLHDDTIDPLRDMDGWLSQVAAMDAVISIANTTIHGAGGLGIPTICLVSQKADWRWIEPLHFQRLLLVSIRRCCLSRFKS